MSEPTRRDTWARNAAIALVLGLVACAIVLAVVNRTTGTEAGVSSADAERACEAFVRERLKAPSTADFSGMAATNLGSSGWMARGSVDAENSFSAMIRSDFVCYMHLSGRDWELESIQGLDD